MIKRTTLATSIALILATGGLTACGGGGGGGDTASSKTLVGTISGFGSVYVNGIKMETDNNTRYRVDDDDAFDDDALGVGMKVRVVGTIDADSGTGRADYIEYDDDVEGPIENLNSISATEKTFEVFGLQVLADANSTVYDDGASFDSLANGQNVEVSGYFDGTYLVASRIEFEDILDEDFEAKGIVTDYDPVAQKIILELANGSTIDVFFNNATELDIPADPTGLFGEIEFIESGGDYIALKIEVDDDDLLDDDDEDVSVYGVISQNEGDWTINGIPFLVNSDTEYEPGSLEDNLEDGLVVKIEGDLLNGVLIAEEIESEQGDIEIEAPVLSREFTDEKNGTITLDVGNDTITVTTNNGTQFEDDDVMDFDDDGSFNLSELNPGDFLEIEAYRNDVGDLVATSVERDDDDEDVEVEGPVDSYSDEVGNLSITVLGVSWSVEPGITDFDSGFFGAITMGSYVSLKDMSPADGIADELELEDD